MGRSEGRHFTPTSGLEEVARVTARVSGTVPTDHSGAHAGRSATEILYVEVADDVRVRSQRHRHRRRSAGERPVPRRGVCEGDRRPGRLLGADRVARVSTC